MEGRWAVRRPFQELRRKWQCCMQNYNGGDGASEQNKDPMMPTKASAI